MIDSEPHPGGPMNLRFHRQALLVAVLMGALLVAPTFAAAPTKAARPAVGSAAGKTAATNAAGAASAQAADDPYLWLEDVTGQKSLDWVAQRNTESKKAITTQPGFGEMQSRFLDILNSTAKIPYVTKIGDAYYNFWKDKEHERGTWRRTTLAEYRKANPAWETVLDLDSLSKADNVLWVWHAAQPLAPENVRCLVRLSKGGADAEVVREFDLRTKSFVTDGFTLPEAKLDVTWENHDAIYVSTDFGPGSMTTSGYARIVKEWKRGTPLSSAATLYECKPEDIGASSGRDDTPGFEKDFVFRSITYYTNQIFLRRAGKLIQIEKPDDAEMGTFRDWILLRLRSDWSAGGKTWPAGALPAGNFEDFLAGKREFQMLFEPGPRKSLDSYVTTKSAVLVNELDNVHNKIYALRFQSGAWTRTPLPGQPELGSLEVAAVDPRESDDYWLTTTDFLTPARLHLGHVGGDPAEKLKEAPAFFDPSRLEVSQHEAVSKDGTRIPYFQVAPKGMKLDGRNPTLLYGYGGFEISELPGYSGTRGAGWMEKGGVFVV
ncbi:MAG: S9 family peptidase, partial [Candidatus Eisenbacteria bacterium]